MTMTEGERMAVLETKVTDLSIRVTDIQTDVKAIILTLSKQPTFEAKILALETQIIEIKKYNTVSKWISQVIIAALSSAITFLLINYLQRV